MPPSAATRSLGPDPGLQRGRQRRAAPRRARRRAPPARRCVYELIFVDDGSTDGTAAQLEAIQARDPEHVRVAFLRRNCGQTAALSAALDLARGEILVPIDGDRQNDPADIPRLLETLDQGYDVVSGWRRNRQDALLSRKIPSWIANRLVARISGVSLHDFGCTLKAYRRRVLAGVRLYGEMHRFIPIFAAWQGAKVTEQVVNHRARTAGKTKYGLGRTFNVVLDLILIRFLQRYAQRPDPLLRPLRALVVRAGLLLLRGDALLQVRLPLARTSGGRPTCPTRPSSRPPCPR